MDIDSLISFNREARSNAHAWFGFLATACPNGEGAISVTRDGSEWFIESGDSGGFRCLAAELPDAEEDGRVRSGDHYEPLQDLDLALRSLRQGRLDLPLVAVLKPDRYRSRNRLWMLGEYLTERDLPMWVDLTSLHPARAADWARNIAECGLANPRTVMDIGQSLTPEDIPALRETGVWVVWTTWDGKRSEQLIRQIT